MIGAVPESETGPLEEEASLGALAEDNKLLKARC